LNLCERHRKREGGNFSTLPPEANAALRPWIPPLAVLAKRHVSLFDHHRQQEYEPMDVSTLLFAVCALLAAASIATELADR
jgi:hypothetical protein